MAPDFGRLNSDAMGDRLLGILRHQALELGLGLFVFEVSYPGAGKMQANSGKALEPLMSIILCTSMRGLGGSTPNRRGARRSQRNARISFRP
jgi:hypothetical protein